MSAPPRFFDHIDLRVSSFATARPFYVAFLGAAGFTQQRGGRPGDEWMSLVAEEPQPRPPFVWIVEEKSHRGGLNRVALYQPTPADVDRVTAVAVAAGALNVEAAEYCEDYGDDYYAAYFEDADGNRWEVCCRHAPPKA